MRQDRGKLYAYLAFVGAFAALNYASRLVPNKPDRNVLYTWSAAIGGLVQLESSSASSSQSRAAGRRTNTSDCAGRARGASQRGSSCSSSSASSHSAQSSRRSCTRARNRGSSRRRWHPDRAAPFVANFLVVAVLAPIVEEITFRGLGYKLLEPFGKWTAILLVGLLFGLAHGLVEALPILAAFGAGLAYVRMRTGSVYPGMIVHSAFNSLVLIVAVTS